MLYSIYDSQRFLAVVLKVRSDNTLYWAKSPFVSNCQVQSSLSQTVYLDMAQIK